ncbi:S8 family serine peptidase [Mesorhizobium intechi]|uniref:S8 family serine peptidase n=1 Tax=Mesorhizobium intechi TaxID=537601 RepID=A0A8T9AVS8_9HYPH|nr:S8 family serine peptidase [Mesorhizobium intechi]TSE13543.1 S8 family serine peptidase [Mesorhizobium intechi]
MAYEYKVMGQTVRLDVDPSAVAVQFHPTQPNSVRMTATVASGAGPFSNRFDIPGEDLTIIPVDPTGPNVADPVTRAQSEGAINALNEQPSVMRAAPVFRVNGNQVVASDRILIGLDKPAMKQAILKKYKLVEVSATDDRIVARVSKDADVFALTAQLDDEAAVRFAEPDLVTIGRHIPKRPVGQAQPPLNPIVTDQYAMRITRASEAWAISTGNPSIRIAILDEGVDTRHPDLAGAITGTFDAGDEDTYQDPNPWDGHGTACAGLAAAAGTAGIGVQGSGTGCSLLGVRIAYSAYKEGPWITSNSKIANAIEWSWKNGAHVLSNSWGGGLPSNAISEEFEKARTRGRAGLGCVVVIAAGNYSTAVQFPGTLPNVLTVSATNEFDELKTTTSMDGENWWGTCFGPEIGIAAPGVHNLTTDISGTSGYAGGDYFPTFNGTSSATPIVAGACGLVLSVNPNLREDEVRTIIQQAADKIGPYPYGASGRNDYFGHGRLNVLAAVRSAIPAVAITDAAASPRKNKKKTDAGKKAANHPVT